MKPSTVLFLSMLIMSACFSRDNNSAALNIERISFNDSLTAALVPAPSVLLEEILKVTGLQKNFELKEAAVMNIEASIHRKKRYILYNPDFVNQLNSVAKNKWALAALLAHEVGHHLNGHTIKKTGSNKKIELEADEFAGFVLQKMGATMQQAEEVMYYVAGPADSKTHPAQHARILAIQKGWLNAAQ